MRQRDRHRLAAGDLARPRRQPEPGRAGHHELRGRERDLGSCITDNISWTWIFYINVPVGLYAAGLTWSTYRDRESPKRKLPIDVVGLALLVVRVGALQIMLDKGSELDRFNSNPIVAPAVVSAGAFVVFALVRWMRSLFNTQAGIETILIATVIQGKGTAFFFVPLVALTLSGLEPDRIPAATGLSNFVRITAGATRRARASGGAGLPEPYPC